MGKKERKPLARALPASGRRSMRPWRGAGPETRYRYRFDRRSLRISAAVSLAVVLFVALYVVWGVQYLPAWILFFVVSVIALYILSIPRYLSLDDDSLDVHCLVDLTRIHVEDIESILRMDRSEFRRLWPLLGSYGFWGYYGYYFNFGEWTLHRVYASDRKKLILIED
ncbi:MAG: PH domain-containing protein, partial [Alistipes onderdonkii]